MPRLSDFSLTRSGNGPALWLRILLGTLVVLNVIALYLFISPPGGSHSDLVNQESSVRREIQTRRMASERLKTVSAKVELGGEQTKQFSDNYFLQQRTASATLVSELLRMSGAAGLQERERTYSREPIEGTDDLTLLTINANYQGSYAQLMSFMNQIDHSDKLLILDTLVASPLKEGQDQSVLNIGTKLLAILKEDGTPAVAAAVRSGR
jgi:hypothetical protein